MRVTPSNTFVHAICFFIVGSFWVGSGDSWEIQWHFKDRQIIIWLNSKRLIQYKNKRICIKCSYSIYWSTDLLCVKGLSHNWCVVSQKIHAQHRPLMLVESEDDMKLKKAQSSVISGWRCGQQLPPQMPKGQHEPFQKCKVLGQGQLLLYHVMTTRTVLGQLVQLVFLAICCEAQTKWR